MTDETLPSPQAYLTAGDQKTGLYDLIVQASEIEALVVEAGGELTPEIEQRLDAITETLTRKVDAVVFVMDRLATQSAAMRTQATRFTLAARALENARERIKERVKAGMLLTARTEIAGDTWALRLKRNAPKLVIHNEATLPEKFKHEIVTKTIELDRKAIIEALKAGEAVPGATLQDVWSLTDKPCAKQITKKGTNNE